MKRTPTPSPHRPQSSHRRQDSSKSQHGFANGTNKNDQKSNSAFKFITVAAKKIAGIFTLAFLFKSKKDTTKAIKDGQSRGLSCELLWISDLSLIFQSKDLMIKLFIMSFLGFPYRADYQILHCLACWLESLVFPFNIFFKSWNQWMSNENSFD